MEFKTEKAILKNPPAKGTMVKFPWTGWGKFLGIKGGLILIQW